MIVFWLILGALMASSIWFVYIKFQATGKMSVNRWILTVISVLWGGFTLAWIVSSIGEGEMQAAGMGLLIFGAILLVFIIVTVRLNSLIPSKKKADKVEAA
ncbi:dehalogenase [Dehalobacter sp. MCB1]|uniref:dehalogenase n=1 Tax=unclassified Dehalobacter TaxID=2635733 RepID=UPI000E6B7A7B|nr:MULTISPECIES: dehalogenase [unclassified Dehalobacter]RJE47283.1 dehalogenase [Dehalobacter sp. MCB1]TCX55322.1 dehalogenase [Dehalobacter sp. 12DCB1]